MGFNLDDYEPVAARLQRWLDTEHSHYQTSVRTYMVSDPASDICVFKAELWLLAFDGTKPFKDLLVATGWAEEVRGAGNVNRTSHVENCETSAVGRALANAGYAGSDVNKRPSREEMSKVQRMSTGTDSRMPEVTITQPSGQASEKQINFAKSMLKSGKFKVPANLDSMTKGEATELIDALKKGTYVDPTNDGVEEPF
jgi:hypothetical protein